MPAGPKTLVGSSVIGEAEGLDYRRLGVGGDIALALSGGGYRAAHFHLGVLRKLRELGLLDRVETISSVSGGSILASLYVASRLREESFEDFETAAEQLLKPSVPLHLSVLLDFVPGASSGEGIAKVLSRYLAHEGRPILLEDLKGKEISPRLVLNCTNVHTGAGWRFESGGDGTHWEIGTAKNKASVQRFFTYRCTGVTLARAVTASAAFPVFSATKVFPPGDIESDPCAQSEDPHSWYLAHGLDKELDCPLLLSDGGVRDNTGVTSVLAGLAGSPAPYVIVSDAGVEAPPFVARKGLWRRVKGIDSRGRVRKLTYLKRQFDIRGRHNNQMITLLALTDYLSRAKEDRRDIAIFRIDRATENSDRARKEAAELHAVDTGLKKLPDGMAERLQEHGGTLLWHRLTEYTDLLAPDQAMSGVERKVEGEDYAPHVLS